MLMVQGVGMFGIAFHLGPASVRFPVAELPLEHGPISAYHPTPPHDCIFSGTRGWGFGIQGLGRARSRVDILYLGGVLRGTGLGFRVQGVGIRFAVAEVPFVHVRAVNSIARKFLNLNPVSIRLRPL
jgi:hypothetical protein